MLIRSKVSVYAYIWVATFAGSRKVSSYSWDYVLSAITGYQVPLGTALVIAGMSSEIQYVRWAYKARGIEGRPGDECRLKERVSLVH